MKYSLQDIHGEKVLVGGQDGVGVERSDLVLAGGDLSVSGGGLDAELPHLDLGVVDAVDHADREIGKVLVVELLTLGRGAAEKRAAREAKVGTLREVLSVDEEELLLGSCVDLDLRSDGDQGSIRCAVAFLSPGRAFRSPS